MVITKEGNLFLESESFPNGNYLIEWDTTLHLFSFYGLSRNFFVGYEMGKEEIIRKLLTEIPEKFIDWYSVLREESFLYLVVKDKCFDGLFIFPMSDENFIKQEMLRSAIGRCIPSRF